MMGRDSKAERVTDLERMTETMAGSLGLPSSISLSPHNSSSVGNTVIAAVLANKKSRAFLGAIGFPLGIQESNPQRKKVD